MKTKEEILKDCGIYAGFRSTYTYDGILKAMDEYVQPYKDDIDKVITVISDEIIESFVEVLSEIRTAINYNDLEKVRDIIELFEAYTRNTKTTDVNNDQIIDVFSVKPKRRFKIVPDEDRIKSCINCVFRTSTFCDIHIQQYDLPNCFENSCHFENYEIAKPESEPQI